MRSTRRRFLEAAWGVGLGLGRPFTPETRAQPTGSRPPSPPPGVAVVNPLDRAPVSLIIDDSTCLVNLAHFCIPQFHEVFPDQYAQPWKTLPREIPDRFVRKFGEWCAERGIKGKYSVIPYPACVGWLDRDLPGWSKAELDASIELVRTLLAPNWDIHPEMISHTWVIDTKTGRPYPERTADFMENWGWSAGKSADQLAEYISYALKILKNVGLKCDGITTPGGFGNRALPELARLAGGLPRRLWGRNTALFPPCLHRPAQRRSACRECLGLGWSKPGMRGLDHRLHRRLVRRLGWTHPRVG